MKLNFVFIVNSITATLSPYCVDKNIRIIEKMHKNGKINSIKELQCNVMHLQNQLDHGNKQEIRKKITVMDQCI